MKKLINFLYLALSILVIFYVSLPNFEFPAPIPNSLQSTEPADMESPLRRAYFTDYTRQEVLDWYGAQFNRSSFMNLKLPTYLMNYPPEESGSIIRDQTRSTFLQEYVHPFRETMYINGYEPAPSDDENRIVINGVHYRQKIIVKFVPTNTLLRLVITILSLVAIPVLVAGYKPEFEFLSKIIKSRKI